MTDELHGVRRRVEEAGRCLFGLKTILSVYEVLAARELSEGIEVIINILEGKGTGGDPYPGVQRASADGGRANTHTDGRQGHRGFGVRPGRVDVDQFDPDCEFTRGRPVGPLRIKQFLDEVVPAAEGASVSVGLHGRAGRDLIESFYRSVRSWA